MSTYVYQDAIDWCQRIVKGIPVSNIDILTIDQINSIFWKAYPWPWTRDTLTSIPLVDSQQDYALQAADLNKVWRLTGARITATTTSPLQYRDLRIMRHLEPYLVGKIGWPNFQLMSYEVEIDKLRLEAAASVPANWAAQIDGEYQYFPPKITSKAATILFPDYHMDVFCSGLLWMLFFLADDERAGTAVRTSAGVQYTGQMGVFFDKLVMTKETEEHGAGDTTYPEMSIGGDVLYFPGVFGW